MQIVPQPSSSQIQQTLTREAGRNVADRLDGILLVQAQVLRQQRPTDDRNQLDRNRNGAPFGNLWL